MEELFIKCKIKENLHLCSNKIPALMQNNTGDKQSDIKQRFSILLKILSKSAKCEHYQYLIALDLSVKVYFKISKACKIAAIKRVKWHQNTTRNNYIMSKVIQVATFKNESELLRESLKIELKVTNISKLLGCLQVSFKEFLSQEWL